MMCSGLHSDMQKSVINRLTITRPVIYDISPMEFPFMSRAARVSAKHTLHEWQTDALAAAAVNANIEGDDSATNTAVPTVRLNNKTQIFKKTVQVSGTQDAMDPAGRARESAYQLMKRGKELKRKLLELIFGFEYCAFAS